MTEIWPDYVAQAFLPPPGLNRQFRTAGPDRVKVLKFHLNLRSLKAREPVDSMNAKF